MCQPAEIRHSTTPAIVCHGGSDNPRLGLYGCGGPDRINITPITIRIDALICGTEGRRMSIAMTYLSRTRVPRIFWLLSALRKFGTRRSISSK